jgi:tetratricopeptide (TPR) repeat protein
MRKPLLIIALVFFCLSGNAQKGKIPVTTSSKKALSFYNEAWKASEDVDLRKFDELISKSLAEDPDFFMAHYQGAIYAAYLGQEKIFIKEATAAVNCKAKLSSGEKIMKDAIKQLLGDRKADLTGYGKKLVEMYPGDINSHLQLMTYQALNKDTDGQISTINNALKLPARKDYLYNALAYAYMTRGQFSEAEVALDRYIALSPQLPNPYDSKGDLYMRTKEYGKAYENFMKANSIDTAWSKGKALRAKSLAERTTQSELMKKLYGTWYSERGRDTTNAFEIIEYNNALLQINSLIIKGIKRMILTCTYVFDPASGYFKSTALWPSGRTELWRVRFTSDREVDFSRVEDMKATNVLAHNTCFFDNPDQITANNYNGDNVRTATSRWVRSGAVPSLTKPNSNIDQLSLMQMQVGRWRSDISKDSSLISEWQRFGNAFTNTTYDVINGEKKVRFTQNLIYSSKEGRFRTFVAYPDGRYLTYLAAFTSDARWEGAFVTDFKPDEINRKFVSDFPSPGQMTVTYFNKEGVKTMVIKWQKED